MTGTELQAPTASADSKPRGRLRTSIVVVAALVGGGIGGTGGFALAAGPWQGGWHHGDRLERMQRMVHRALDSVGATTVQEDKAHDIIAANFADTKDVGEERQAMRKQMLELLRAPTIDRTAIEKLRGEQVAAFDAHSKKTVGAILDVADQLTPDQRAKLADRFEMMAQHRRGMEGPWGGPHGRERHGPNDDGPDRNGGPDGGPDKG